jgi:2-phospho-L-lactate guanylyltransferase (CobY/MobA/RfbA family)
MLTEGIPSGFLNSPGRVVRPWSGSARSATVLSAGSEEGIVKQAILATVITVVKKQADSVAVLLKSEELSEANRVIHTGLNREHSFKSSGSILEVICSGDPKAKAGDNVPVIVDLEPMHKVS